MKLPVFSVAKKLLWVAFVALLVGYVVKKNPHLLIAADPELAIAAAQPARPEHVVLSEVAHCQPDWVVTGIRPQWQTSQSDHGLVHLISYYRQLGYPEPMITASIEQSGYLPSGARLPPFTALATTDLVLGADLHHRWSTSIRQLAEQQGIAAVLDAYSDISHPLFANEKPDVQQLTQYLLLLAQPSLTAEHLLRLKQLGLVVDLSIFKIVMMQPTLGSALYPQLLQLYQGSLVVVLQEAFSRMSAQSFGEFVEMVLFNEPGLEFALDPLVQKLQQQQVGTTANAADQGFWQSVQQKFVILLQAGFQLKQQSTIELLQKNDSFPPQLTAQLLNTAAPLAVTQQQHQLQIPAMVQQLTELKGISEQWPALEFVSWSICGDTEKNLITYQMLKQYSSLGSVSAHQPMAALQALLQLNSELEKTHTLQLASTQTQNALLQPDLGMLLQQVAAGTSELNEHFAGSTVWEIILSQHRRTPSQPDVEQVLQWAAELSATDSRAIYALAAANLPALVDQVVQQGVFNHAQQEMLAIFLLTEQQPQPSPQSANLRAAPLVAALKSATPLRGF
jgi:hypothetical protein